MKDVRRKLMERYIEEQRSASMEELCQKFQVSMNTVRADVAYLAKIGAVEKVYGGVRAVEQQLVPLFVKRVAISIDEKKRIAQRAEAMIENRDSIFIDAGTTTMHIIDFLSPEKEVTIITNNLYIISHAAQKPGADVIVLPGQINRRTNSIADGSTLEFLSRYHFTKAFMAASGISADGRINVSTYQEYEVKKLALGQSQKAYLLADGGKFGLTALMSYGALDQMRAVITERDAPKGLVDICAEQNVELIQV